MSLFRPTANGLVKKLGLAALCLGLLGAVAPQAAAGQGYYGYWGPMRPAPEAVNEELAVCPGQDFYQPFLALGDGNYYTLVEGSEFDGDAEGWSLRRGAAIVAANEPNGSEGMALELPPDAVAVSPPVCVTLQYPTARTWVRAAGEGGLAVGVFYAGTRWSRAAGDYVARLDPPDRDWTLSDPFDVRPELGGWQEGQREVRFVFLNQTWSASFQLSGLFVDPRMR